MKARQIFSKLTKLFKSSDSSAKKVIESDYSQVPAERKPSNIEDYAAPPPPSHGGSLSDGELSASAGKRIEERDHAEIPKSVLQKNRRDNSSSKAGTSSDDELSASAGKRIEEPDHAEIPKWALQKNKRGSSSSKKGTSSDDELSSDDMTSKDKESDKGKIPKWAGKVSDSSSRSSSSELSW